MSDEKAPPPSGWRALIGFVQQWQVLLALAVGVSGLWFNYNEQRRKELDVNREAVKTAHETSVVAAFLDDPRNTLIEYQATYPRHAFCAALGFFIAENGRAARKGEGGRKSSNVLDSDAALRAQVEALAAEARVNEASFEAFAKAAEASAGATATEANCPRVKLDPPLGAGLLLEPECLLAIDTFGQNLCEQKRWTNELTAAVSIEQMTMGAATVAYSIPPRIVPAPGPQTSAVVEPPEPSAEPAAIPAPGSACGGVSPLIFPQFTDGADADRVGALRDQLIRAGWTIAKAEHVPKGITTGDLRYYGADQQACAESLAEIVGGTPGVNRPIKVISLAARYRSPPGNQMELWLPALE
ncbi:hypothetical protein [uncultured Amaricoccus sp.]|uniref:hypothetical protein n=1 Tax=uncultured Amaricoccus sp. TaxID=339341 RepID=UPI00262E37F5|nr:hypothetical protein [uncultured Amaricoccus sp.]